MWLKLKICFGYAILVLLLAFIVYQFRKEQVLRHMLRKEEKELAAIHSLAEKKLHKVLLDLSTHAEIAITWDDNDLKNYSYKRYGVLWQSATPKGVCPYSLTKKPYWLIVSSSLE